MQHDRPTPHPNAPRLRDESSSILAQARRSCKSSVVMQETTASKSGARAAVARLASPRPHMEVRVGTAVLASTSKPAANTRAMQNKGTLWTWRSTYGGCEDCSPSHPTIHNRRPMCVIPETSTRPSRKEVHRASGTLSPMEAPCSGRKILTHRFKGRLVMTWGKISRSRLCRLAGLTTWADRQPEYARTTDASVSISGGPLGARASRHSRDVSVDSTEAHRSSFGRVSLWARGGTRIGHARQTPSMPCGGPSCCIQEQEAWQSGGAAVGGTTVQLPWAHSPVLKLLGSKHGTDKAGRRKSKSKLPVGHCQGTRLQQ